MSSRAKKSFAWLWMAALLTATVGISVQQIYCYCKGATTVSLFVAEDACSAEERANDGNCCSEPESEPVFACCGQKSETCDTDQDGCMEKSTKVFQLKTEFVVDKPKPFEKTFDCPLWLREMPMFRRYFRPVVCEAGFFNNLPPPPPLSGRDICLRHQLYRC
jgi:hypothetical protein